MKNTILTMARALGVGPTLHAQVYQYGIGDLDHDATLDPGSLAYNPGAGYVDSLSTQFNAGTQCLDFSVDFKANAGSLARFFLVGC